MTCEKAFEYAERKNAICNVDVIYENPDCGHMCSIKCHQAKSLSTYKRTKPAIKVVDENDPSSYELLNVNKFHISCQEKILLKRNCGHEDNIKCFQIANKSYSKCNALETVLNPLCEHLVRVKCSEKDEIQNWKPWSNDFIESDSYKEFKKDNIFKEGSFKPNYLSSKTKLPDCEGKIKLIRKNCEHIVEMKCGDAFKIIYQTNKLAPCKEKINEQLRCGHSHERICGIPFNRDEFKCKNLVQKLCWNFNNCKKKVETECYSNNLPSCDSETQWICKNNHTFNLKVCAIGSPLSCPLCIIDNVSIEITNLNNIKLFSLVKKAFPKLESKFIF
jgi:hypothetical protein